MRLARHSWFALQCDESGTDKDARGVGGTHIAVRGGLGDAMRLVGNASFDNRRRLPVLIVQGPDPSQLSIQAVDAPLYMTLGPRPVIGQRVLTYHPSDWRQSFSDAWAGEVVSLLVSPSYLSSPSR